MFLFNYELHLLSFLYLFLHLVFFEFPSGDAAFDTHCSTTICDGVNISYPFWVVTDADMYCGYRDFGLNCSDGNTTKPILDLPEDSYYVTDINYDNNFLTLVDKDVSGVNCPRVRHNLTVGTFPLSYNHTLDVNISFYFDCTSSYANGVLNLISCWGIEDKHYSYVFIEGEEPEGFLDVRNSCEEKVVAAVKDEAVSVPNLNDAFDEALNGGFVLDWDTAKECGACEHSKGKCGYNNRTGQFLCFCDDESIKINGKYCSGSQRALRQKALIDGLADR